jgi:hypothetical protein
VCSLNELHTALPVQAGAPHGFRYARSLFNVDFAPWVSSPEPAYSFLPLPPPLPLPFSFTLAPIPRAFNGGFDIWPLLVVLHHAVLRTQRMNRGSGLSPSAPPPKQEDGTLTGQRIENLDFALSGTVAPLNIETRQPYFREQSTHRHLTRTHSQRPSIVSTEFAPPCSGEGEVSGRVMIREGGGGD